MGPICFSRSSFLFYTHITAALYLFFRSWSMLVCYSASPHAVSADGCTPSTLRWKVGFPGLNWRVHNYFEFTVGESFFERLPVHPVSLDYRKWSSYHAKKVSDLHDFGQGMKSSDDGDKNGIYNEWASRRGDA
jgi:hypothetical protein